METALLARIALPDREKALGLVGQAGDFFPPSSCSRPLVPFFVFSFRLPSSIFRPPSSLPDGWKGLITKPGKHEDKNGSGHEAVTEQIIGLPLNFAKTTLEPKRVIPA